MYRLDRILCPIDFSPASVEAVRFAAFLARNANSQLTLIHVDEHEKSPLGFFDRDDSSVAQYREKVNSFVQAKFTEIIKREHLSPEPTSILVRFGTAYHEIIDVAEEDRYSLVVIATEGLGGSSPHLIGRTAERVVRLCRAPVLTVRPRQQPDG